MKNATAILALAKTVTVRRTKMPAGKGTYGKKRGRPAKKNGKKKTGKKGLTAAQKKLPPALQKAIMKKRKKG